MRTPATSASTRLSVLATLAAGVHLWAGVVLVFSAVWLYTQTERDRLSPRKSWLLAPVFIAAFVWLYNGSVPQDDLMRHIPAWQLNYSYPVQYPWSDLPAANFWLGFDWALGALQHAGASPQQLLQGVPVIAFLLGGLVFFFSLRSAAPQVSANAFLLVGLLGLFLIAPRMFLGRPEAFVSIVAAAVWLCTTRVRIAAWVGLMLLCIPVYWLGWAYAPFALLLPVSWLLRFTIASGLFLANLVVWQIYTGDYLGMMVWLKGTLSVQASENAPLGAILLTLPGMAFALLLSVALFKFSLGRELIPRDASPFWQKKTMGIAPLLLLLWLILPNQIRYSASIAFALLPWLLQQVSRWEGTNLALEQPVWTRISSLVLIAVLTLSSVHLPPTQPEPPKFALNKGAKVFAENPYAAVFYAKGLIQVEPSFALGATKTQWKDLLKNKDTKLDCSLVKRAGFTHVIEQSLAKRVDCLDLIDVQGPWRLWVVKTEP